MRVVLALFSLVALAAFLGMVLEIRNLTGAVSVPDDFTTQLKGGISSADGSPLFYRNQKRYQQLFNSTVAVGDDGVVVVGTGPLEIALYKLNLYDGWMHQKQLHIKIGFFEPRLDRQKLYDCTTINTADILSNPRILRQSSILYDLKCDEFDSLGDPRTAAYR